MCPRSFWLGVLLLTIYTGSLPSIHQASICPLYADSIRLHVQVCTPHKLQTNFALVQSFLANRGFTRTTRCIIFHRPRPCLYPLSITSLLPTTITTSKSNRYLGGIGDEDLSVLGQVCFHQRRIRKIEGYSNGAQPS